MDLLTDLFKAYYDARRNKRNTPSQLRFESHLEENLIELYEELRDHRYSPRPCTCFVIEDPVKREVFASDFRDRVVHHLYYNYVAPIFERTFIYDSYSCREGKGTLFGINRLEHHLRAVTNNYTQEAYILKLDIRGYFMSIRRELTLRCSPPNVGLPIGDLTSQLFSNVLLNDLDWFVTRTLGFTHYGRYVDDFYLCSTDKNALKQAIDKIRNYLADRGLTLHPKKIVLQRATERIRFLGAEVYPYCRRVRSRTVVKFNKVSSDFMSQNAQIPFDDAQKHYATSVLNSYLGYLKHFNTYLWLSQIAVKLYESFPIHYEGIHS